MIRGGMPPEIERYILGWKDIQLDARTLLFTLVAAVLSGILAGLAPAWQCSRPNLTDALKEGGRGGPPAARVTACATSWWRPRSRWRWSCWWARA